ncbi:hypothetical protein WKW80_34540 [Variovorax humicola]|uniref:RanBP2-type domain-containing protein n=1 Tax=Variovorax humicola TaxID=1769758 RepID=A0ABU8WAI5_9BURK
MNASPTNNIGPLPTVEFSELGVMLELLWRGERTALAKCTFCRTLNHRSASHCAACASKLPAIYWDQSVVARNPPSTPTGVTPTRLPVGAGGHVRRELANMLLWMLAIPLALFVGFVGWYTLHRGDQPSPASAVVAVSALPDGRAELTQTTSLAKTRKPESPGGVGVTANPNKEIVMARADKQRMPVVAPTRAASPTPPPQAPRWRIPRSAAPSATDPTASCNSEMFLLRAMCLNRQCAEPQNATHSRCIGVVRQRRIDEARRNPTLVG